MSNSKAEKLNEVIDEITDYLNTIKNGDELVKNDIYDRHYRDFVKFKREVYWCADLVEEHERAKEQQRQLEIERQKIEKQKKREEEELQKMRKLGLKLSSDEEEQKKQEFTERLFNFMYEYRRVPKMSDFEDSQVMKNVFGSWSDALLDAKRKIIIQDINDFNEKTGKVPRKKDTINTKDFVISSESNVYKKIFGNWSNALIEAGFHPDYVGCIANKNFICNICGKYIDLSEYHYKINKQKICLNCRKKQLFDKVLVARALGLDDSKVCKLNKDNEHKCDIYDDVIGYTVIDTENREIDVEYAIDNGNNRWEYSIKRFMRNSSDVLYLLAFDENMENITNVWKIDRHYTDFIDEYVYVSNQIINKKYKPVIVNKATRTFIDTYKTFPEPFDEAYKNLEFMK
ncbi:MAG: homing endonuclease associated repeat-containing protein [archaeon]